MKPKSDLTMAWGVATLLLVAAGAFAASKIHDSSVSKKSPEIVEICPSEAECGAKPVEPKL